VNQATTPTSFQRNWLLALLFPLILFAIAASGCASGRGASSRQTVRVMTWNIHHGEGLDKNIDLDRIAERITDEKADIVAIQEVDRGVERSKKIDMITKLADITGMTYAFGKTIDYQGGDFGNAFLTRFPIFEERSVLFKKSPDAEQRGVLLLVLGIIGEEVVVANTHLDSQGNDSLRVAGVNELKSILKGYSSRATIICGDFNDIPSGRVVTQLKEEYLDAWEQAGTWEGFTFPSDVPKKRIDYVFTNKTRRPDSASSAVHLRPLSARVAKSLASDHLPLIVEFELSTER
jgi:endonuclease/exonuclease/phosphatase family metal-dependent hydrolase